MPDTTTKGLSEVGNGIYAYVQLNTATSWSWSNAGLIASGPTSLLVDTLYTLSHTQEMLDAMRAATPAASSIDVLVNSHADPDHTFGNQLVSGAQIIATENAAEDMAVNLTPDQVRSIYSNTDELGAAGRFFAGRSEGFDFSGIELVFPTETFSGRKTLQVGEKTVELIDVGPAHTRGDLIVYVPEDRVAFVGDLLFTGAHPVLWSGPVSNWTRACDLILDLDVDVVVAGHGPVSDPAGVREYRDYLEYVDTEAKEMHSRGLSVKQAVSKIDLSAYSDWLDRERIVLAIDTIYQGLEGNTDAPDYLRVFGEMEEYLESEASAEGQQES
jgi:glyoxylase-like metal-dependent hydrolase (beta-lactamase superfamily II)